MESDNSSEILNLQILENEYNLVMQQYEQANLNLIASLKSQDILNNTYTSLPGRTNWGSENLWGGKVDSENECKSKCDSDPLCVGATYSVSKELCWTAKGKNEINTGLSDDYALIKEKNKNYVSLPGRTFFGTTGLKEGAVDSENECKALCSSDPLCTGATYNASKSYCWTRSGKGDIAPGLGDDVALITEVTQNANTVQQLNDKLTDLNLKIGEALNKAIPEVRLQMNEKAEKQGTLQSVYSQLLIDRKNIDSMLKEYQMIEQQYDDKTIYVDQNHSAHILWIIIAILVVIFTLKMQFFPTSNSNPIKFIFWFLYAVLFAIVTTRLNSAPGFFLWGLIIVIFALMQMKIMPSP
jgi:hypothetical protein